MKKVSVTDKYTYDGKEMTERDIEVYKAGIEDGQFNWEDIILIAIMGGIIGVIIGGLAYKLLKQLT